MHDSSYDRRVWTFTRPLGRLDDGQCSCQVDVTRPALGLHQLCVGEHGVAGNLLSVAPDGPAAWPNQVSDAYVRGADLVATYEPSDAWPYASQLYWRAEPAEPAAGILASLSLLVSIQTSLLDTHPRVRVSSCQPVDEVLRLTVDDHGQAHVEAATCRERVTSPRTGVCCVLRRLAGGELSCAELMPAGDFRQLSFQIATDGDCHSRWELFAEFLEKGVIRRARLQTVVMNRQHDLELATTCCRQLQDRPLPLTT